MRVGVIIQARMGSSRLPGKVMKNIEGKTILQHVIDRLKESKIVDEVIVATTINKIDDILEDECINLDIKCFRGSEDDVLSRYYFAAKENNLDVVIRVTSDCPLIDPIILDKMILFYLENNYDIVTNAGSDLTKRTFPRGLDVEIFSFEALQYSYRNAKESYQKEHVTPYIYENSSKIFHYLNEKDYSNYRWTVDTEEDLIVIEKIYSYLYKDNRYFYLDEILDLFNKYPELFEINKHIEQKKIK